MMQVGWAEVRGLQSALDEMRELPVARPAVSV